MDIILMLLGTILLLVLLYFVTEMPKWNKRHYRRIYKSPGKKRTARKSREDPLSDLYWETAYMFYVIQSY